MAAMVGRSIFCAVLGLAPALLACGTTSSLDGSISEILSLDFDRTVIKKEGLVLVLDYVAGADDLAEITLRLALSTRGLELPEKAAEVAGNVFVGHVSLLRASKNNEQFPAIEAGNLSFELFEFSPGGQVSGRFSTLFADGRSLKGTFDGAVNEL